MIAIRRRRAPRITALLYLGDFSRAAQQSFPDWMPPVLLVEAVAVRSSTTTYRCYPLGLDHVPGWQDTAMVVPAEHLSAVSEWHG